MDRAIGRPLLLLQCRTGGQGQAHTGERPGAACDLRGKIRGDWIDARARLIEDARLKEEVYAVLRRKYGWQMRLGDFFARLSGRYQRRAVIELVL